MDYLGFRELSAQEELLAYVIGDAVLRYLETEDVMKKLLLEAQTKAERILEEIRSVLNDDGLNDPECFRRIEDIIRIYEQNYIGTARHDF